MKPAKSLVVAAIPLFLLAACESEPRKAAEELQGGVLFYHWPHGDSLTAQPEQVASMRAEKVRSLQELEDFSGTLEDWGRRTSPVDRISVGADDFVIDERIFFYFLASLSEPAVAPQYIARITIEKPDGTEILGHEERRTARMNKHVQAGGLLFSMQGLDFGAYVLRMEMLDGETVAAHADLKVDYHPGAGTEGPGDSAGEDFPSR